MQTILSEIDRAIGAGFYYLALAMCLTLPDLCSALESPDGETSGPQYKKWCDEYLVKRLPPMTANDFWKLRCGVIHQGRLGHPQMGYDRIIFTLPDGRNNQAHCNIINNALNLDAIIFYVSMFESVRAWSAAKTADPNVIANLPNLVQFRPRGLFGLPCIA